ncbi:vesicular glutamate transporter 1-like [Planococcus citri]|uniref:vesicular glutamate transporter 1-like n=1 Tax=Planococcus citri TaxID=170843 RepID=UPI0031F8A82E
MLPNQQMQNQNGKVRSNVTPSIWFSKRFFVAIVMFLCYANTNMVMININIAIVEMVSDKVIVSGNQTTVQPAEFQWDPFAVSIISSIYFYGGLFSVFGGYFVQKMGGSVSGAFAMTISGLLTMLQPAALYLDFRVFLTFRLLNGFFANCFFLSAAEIYSRWIPRKERSTLISFSYMGINFSSVISYPLFGYMADRLGWQMVFYVSGMISIASSLLCFIIVKNQPSQDKWISTEELRYILDGIDNRSTSKTISHPYKKILSSGAVWTLCLAKFSLLWQENITSGCLPLYIKDMTGKSTDQIGVLSSIPKISTIVIYPLAGALLDYWKNNTGIQLTRMHKIVITFSFLLASVLFTLSAFFSNFIITLIIFTAIQIIGSMAPPVIEPNMVNIAPNDSCVVTGLCKVFASLSMLISRTLTGLMTINHSLQEWNNCFLLTSVVLIIGTAIFNMYGSSEAQSWSLSSDGQEERDHLINNKNRNQK